MSATLKCAATGCPAVWYGTSANHGQVIRRAVQRGWRGTGDHGCICADARQFCPDHADEETR